MVDDLAQFIREVDGNHTLGAGALAEKIVEWLQPYLANPAAAAIQYAIENPCDEPIEFLRHWMYGDFDVIRRGWYQVPEDVFIGADPTHPKTKILY